MRKRRNMYSANPRNQRPITGCLTVTAEECQGNADKMVRRFIKKSKKEGIVEEYRSRTHYAKPSDVKREEKRRRQRMIEKVNKRRDELLKPRDPKVRKAKRR